MSTSATSSAPKAKAAAPKPAAAKKPAPKPAAAKAKAETAAEPFHKAFTVGQDQVQSYMDKMQTGADVMRDAADDTVEAVKTSSERAASSLRDMNIEMMELAQNEVSRFMEHTNSILNAKTLNEMIEAQTDFFTKTMEIRMETARSVHERGMETAQSIAQPITAAANAAADRAQELQEGWFAEK